MGVVDRGGCRACPGQIGKNVTTTGKSSEGGGKCLAAVSDLIFATRIKSTAELLGAACQVVATTDGIATALSKGSFDLAIVDMHVSSMSPTDAIRHIKQIHPGTRIVAFFSHVQTDLMRAAQEAGADEVWPRSKFVQELPGLFST